MKKILLSGMLSVLFFTGCSSTHKPHWEYSGEYGPCKWGQLYPVCKTGKAQSPINIVTKDIEPLKESHNIIFHEENKAVLSHEVDNGHAIKIIPQNDHGIELEGVNYKLIQYHFHGRSEHTIDGRSFDMVMHMVHQNKKGELAVVGVFMQEGEHNTALESLISHLDGGDVQVAPASLLPKDTKHFYHYTGSLTTPPCTEQVKWYLLKEPISLDRTQLIKFRKHYSTNYRPVQPLNGRKIEIQ